MNNISSFQELNQVLPQNKNLQDAKEYFKIILESIQVRVKNILQFRNIQYLNSIFQSLNDAFHVNFANRIFVDKIVNFNQRFGATIEHFYNTKIINSEFSDAAGSAQLINNWVKEATNGKIEDLVTDGAIQKSLLVLISALNFEGSWKFPFNTTSTRDFVTAPETKVSKEFIEETKSFYSCNSQNLNAKIQFF